MCTELTIKYIQLVFYLNCYCQKSVCILKIKTDGERSLEAGYSLSLSTDSFFIALICCLETVAYFCPLCTWKRKKPRCFNLLKWRSYQSDSVLIEAMCTRVRTSKPTLSEDARRRYKTWPCMQSKWWRNWTARGRLPSVRVTVDCQLDQRERRLD